jgi:hypothetical protein
MTKLSKIQREVLQAAADGRLIRSWGGQFPQTYIALDSGSPGTIACKVRAVTLDALSSLLELGPATSLGAITRRYRLTDLGTRMLGGV